MLSTFSIYPHKSCTNLDLKVAEQLSRPASAALSRKRPTSSHSTSEFRSTFTNLKVRLDKESLGNHDEIREEMMLKRPKEDKNAKQDRFYTRVPNKLILPKRTTIKQQTKVFPPSKDDRK
jgi:hypothetical protein